MDDPVLSPEAQQVIDRLRALLNRLEKDLEDIRFKASYFELLRLGQIRKQILDLVQPLRYQLPYQEVYRLRQEDIITPHRISALDQPAL